jgi:hypothetical protein
LNCGIRTGFTGCSAAVLARAEAARHGAGL